MLVKALQKNKTNVFSDTHIKSYDLHIEQITPFTIDFFIPLSMSIKKIADNNISSIEIKVSRTRFATPTSKNKKYKSTSESLELLKNKNKNIIFRKTIDVSSYFSNDGSLNLDNMINKITIVKTGVESKGKRLDKKEMTKILSLGKDPSAAIIDTRKQTASDVSQGTTSIKVSNDISEIFSSTYTTKIENEKSKNNETILDMPFEVNIPKKYATGSTLYVELEAKTDRGKTISTNYKTVNFSKMINELNKEQTKPDLFITKGLNGNRVIVKPTSKNTKLITLYKKIITSNFKNRTFEKLAVLNVDNLKSVSFFDKGEKPSIYRAVAQDENEFSSAVIGNSFNDIMSEIRVSATQVKKSIEIGVHSLPVETINVNLYRRSVRRKKFEIIQSIRVNKREKVVFTDSRLSHYNKYEYKVVAVLTGGLEEESQTSNAVEYIEPSDAFTLSISTKKISKNKNKIFASYTVPETDSSLLHSSLMSDFPDLQSKDADTIIKNYKQICMVLLERINLDSGIIDIIGYNSDTDDGKITFTDKINKYGKYKYRATLFSRSISQVLADIRTSGKFTKNNQKFMQYIPDELINESSDLNFKEKFFSPTSLFDGTLSYGKSLAYQPENIIEIGKTGVIAESKSFTLSRPISSVKSARINDSRYGPKISLKITNQKNVDSILIVSETASGKSVQSSLLPRDGSIKYTDNIYKNGDGNIKYYAVIVYNDLSVSEEKLIGSYNADRKTENKKARK